MLKEYFYYTRIERNGAIILLLICICLALLPSLYRLFEPTAAPQFVTSNALLAVAEKETSPEATFVNTTEESTEKAAVKLFNFDPNTASVEQLQKLGLSPKVAHTIDNYRSKGGQFRNKADLQKIYGLSEADFARLKPYIALPESQRASEPMTKANSTAKITELFEFNPNVASQDELQRLGLSPKVARTLINYRNKGGTFSKPSDLQKIYGLSETDFNRLQPYITIPNVATAAAQNASGQPAEKNTIPEPYETSFEIDINTATAEEWQRLRGIGPAFSKRIVKFREALGGFARIEQIAETYGLPDSTYQAIKPRLKVSTQPVTLNINTASKEDLKKHPYISWKQADVIVNYRTQHGAFSTLEDVSKVKIISTEQLEKLKAYLVFE